MFPIVFWLEAGHWRFGGAAEWVLNLRTSANDLRLSRSHQPMGAKVSHEDAHPVPGPPPRPRMPVHLKPPLCHPHEIVPVVPQRSLAWAHEPDWAVLASVASASLTGPWTSPALRAPRLASETLHSASAPPRPCLCLGPASDPVEVSQPKARAAPRSATNRFMPSQEVPTVELLKPQRDTDVDEDALSVQTTRQLSPCPCVAHTSLG